MFYIAGGFRVWEALSFRKTGVWSSALFLQNCSIYKFLITSAGVIGAWIALAHVLLANHWDPFLLDTSHGQNWILNAVKLNKSVKNGEWWVVFTCSALFNVVIPFCWFKITIKESERKQSQNVHCCLARMGALPGNHPKQSQFLSLSLQIFLCITNFPRIHPYIYRVSLPYTPVNSVQISRRLPTLFSHLPARSSKLTWVQVVNKWHWNVWNGLHVGNVAGGRLAFRNQSFILRSKSWLVRANSFCPETYFVEGNQTTGCFAQTFFALQVKWTWNSCLFWFFSSPLCWNFQNETLNWYSVS